MNCGTFAIYKLILVALVVLSIVGVLIFRFNDIADAEDSTTITTLTENESDDILRRNELNFYNNKYNGNWSYLYFQHPRKSAGNSICRLLIKNNMIPSYFKPGACAIFRGNLVISSIKQYKMKANQIRKQNINDTTVMKSLLSSKSQNKLKQLQLQDFQNQTKFGYLEKFGFGVEYQPFLADTFLRYYYNSNFDCDLMTLDKDISNHTKVNIYHCTTNNNNNISEAYIEQTININNDMDKNNELKIGIEQIGIIGIGNIGLINGRIGIGPMDEWDDVLTVAILRDPVSRVYSDLWYRCGDRSINGFIHCDTSKKWQNLYTKMFSGVWINSIDDDATYSGYLLLEKAKLVLQLFDIVIVLENYNKEKIQFECFGIYDTKLKKSNSLHPTNLEMKQQFEKQHKLQTMILKRWIKERNMWDIKLFDYVKHIANTKTEQCIQYLKIRERQRSQT